MDFPNQASQTQLTQDFSIIPQTSKIPLKVEVEDFNQKTGLEDAVQDSPKLKLVDGVPKILRERDNVSNMDSDSDV
jgi:hypothetical protein